MPSYFQEGNAPLPEDNQMRSLQKINSLLKDQGENGIRPVSGTVSSQSGNSSNSQALAANYARLSFSIQNNSVSPMTITMGTGVLILSGCTGVASDGTGGYYYDDEWKGIVSVSGVGLNYNVIENI